MPMTHVTLLFPLPLSNAGAALNLASAVSRAEWAELRAEAAIALAALGDPSDEGRGDGGAAAAAASLASDSPPPSATLDAGDLFERVFLWRRRLAPGKSKKAAAAPGSSVSAALRYDRLVVVPLPPCPLALPAAGEAGEAPPAAAVAAAAAALCDQPSWAQACARRCVAGWGRGS